jgi:hypothetical protein
MKDFSPSGRKIKMLSVEYIFGLSISISILLSIFFDYIYKFNGAEQFVVCALLCSLLLILHVATSIYYVYKKYSLPFYYKNEILIGFGLYIGIFFLPLLHPVIAFFTFCGLFAFIVSFITTEYYQLVIKLENGLFVTTTYDDISPDSLESTINTLIKDHWVSDVSLQHLSVYLLRQSYHRNELHLYSEGDLVMQLSKYYYCGRGSFTTSDDEIRKVLTKVKQFGV